MRNIFFPVTSCTLIFASIVYFTTTSSTKITKKSIHQDNRPLIRFNSEGKLKIAIFADLHYGEEPSSSWGPAADIKSSNVTGHILDWEQPDFVVFTGDQLTAENMFPNASAYVHMLVKPLVDRGYRWASTYGNHDIGPNVTRLEILEAEQTYQNLSYTVQMTNQSIPGVTNYYLPIYPETRDENEGPIMIWWFFDSQGGRNNDGQQPHYIDPKVIEWFEEENAKLVELWGALPSLVFFHIPPVEFVEIQENIATDPLCAGLVDDAVTPQDNNTGIMAALERVGGVQAVFVGHDHGNGWCCFYNEIQVCYGRHTGYGGYGTWTRGARIVNLQISLSDEVVTRGSYILLENGTVVDNFPK